MSMKPYRGINVFMLMCAGYESPYWMTYRQAQSVGGQVRKGEKGCPVIYWNVIEKEETNSKGQKVKRKIPFLRYYTVFNLEQIDGLETVKRIASKIKKPEARPEFTPIEVCETLVGAVPNPPTIEHRGGRACYSPLTDKISLPAREKFEGPEEYYSTLFHELGHATGHETRLNRDEIVKHTGFGSHTYSKEELVAEMTAAFMCGEAGIETATLENSAAYIRTWLQKLSENPKWLVEAAAKAQKAADYLLNKTPAEKPEGEDKPRAKKAKPEVQLAA
jgi:antirestriction protein ArdC